MKMSMEEIKTIEEILTDLVVQYEDCKKQWHGSLDGETRDRLNRIMMRNTDQFHAIKEVVNVLGYCVNTWDNPDRVTITEDL